VIYRLNKLNYKEWNDALDLYLKYKKRKPEGTWHSWYTGRVEHVNTLREMEDKFPNVEESDILSHFDVIDDDDIPF